MGHRRDAEITTFERESGIRPATGKQAETLRRIQERALELIRAVELERAGVRDGDGYWSGAYPLESIAADITRCVDAYTEELPFQ